MTTDPGFSLREKLLNSGLTPKPYLETAYALLNSGVPINIRTYNPLRPMDSVRS